jgi:hypothetical protein
LLKCVKVGAQIISASLMSFEAVCCFFIMRQQCYQPTNSVYGQFYAKNAKKASYPQIKSGKVAFQQIQQFMKRVIILISLSGSEFIILQMHMMTEN